MTREARRIYRKATAEENGRLQRVREQIADELPDLVRADQMRKAAAEEDTFSGALRRAVHKHELSLTQIAGQCGISGDELDDFLTGERDVALSVIDRLVEVLGCKLVSIERVK
jgi:hypothetical protein